MVENYTLNLNHFRKGGVIPFGIQTLNARDIFQTSSLFEIEARKRDNKASATTGSKTS